MRRNFVILAAVLLLACFAVYQNIETRHQETILPTEQAPEPNYLAPSFTLSSLDGAVYQVGGQRDKPLFINFWASWCGPCEEEAPDLVEMYHKYKDQFDLYAVNVTQGDNLEDVKRFAMEHKFPFPVLLDKEGKATELYRFLFIPTSYLIDKNGVVREVIHVLPSKELERKIRNLING